MAHGKSVHSYKANVGPILDRAVEQISTEVRPHTSVKPTLADCIKYGMDINHAGESTPEQLTKEDYILLRQNGVLVKEIRTMYCFKDHNQFYKTITKFDIDPKELKADPVADMENIVLSPDRNAAESLNHIPVSAEPIAEIIPSLPTRINLEVITKYICPFCTAEYNFLNHAEKCLQDHNTMTITLADGRTAVYSLTGLR